MGEYRFQCEGRLWKEKPFYMANKGRPTNKKYKSYWCRGGSCAERNEDIDLDIPVEDWTINEIAEVLNATINQELLAFIAGWCNRRNEILERLFCRECGQGLKPKPHDVKILGYYAVPLFHCVNESCEKYGENIRLTHCCNGNCTGPNQTIIDNRDCPQCSSDWLVCQDCYACCKEHHDKSEAHCPKCGSKLMNEYITDEETNWWCSDNNCNFVCTDEEVSNLKKFWKKKMRFDPDNQTRDEELFF